MDSFMFKNTKKKKTNMNKEQGPTIQHMALYSISCENIQYSQYHNGEEYEKENLDVYMCN